MLEPRDLLLFFSGRREIGFCAEIAVDRRLRELVKSVGDAKHDKVTTLLKQGEIGFLLQVFIV